MQCALGYHPHSKTPPLSFLPSPLKFPKCPSPFFPKIGVPVFPKS